MSNGRPVHIRRNIDNYHDPYIQTHGPHEVTVCGECKSVYHDQRWYLEKQAGDTARLSGEVGHTTCPACLKIRDKMPGGIVKLTGGFLNSHKEEILNLIKNQDDRARRVNPLERVMQIEANGGVMDVHTTNEKLAQRIGRALPAARPLPMRDNLPPPL